MTGGPAVAVRGEAIIGSARRDPRACSVSRLTQTTVAAELSIRRAAACMRAVPLEPGPGNSASASGHTFLSSSVIALTGRDVPT
jgi:hypothetical protein